jgi:S-adenosyl-L-methionine hydrolase (adenosine-forming)
MRPLVTFSSDYGPTDEYVGVCQLVMAQIAPEIRIVDVVHGIEGVRAGSVILAQALPFSPPGVHLAVVDPGVGTERRALVIATTGGSHLVGPDNGLLLPAAQALGGITGAWELIEPRFQLAPVSQTFHGRDIFAPAAAHLALGTSPDSFGQPVPSSDLVRLPPPLVEVSDGMLVSEVARFDHYGNIQLAATAGDIDRAALGGRVSVDNEGTEITARVGLRFADAEPGGLVVYLDSGGSVAVAARGASARVLFGDPDQLTIKRKA